MQPSPNDTWITRPRLVDPGGGLDFLIGQHLASAYWPRMSQADFELLLDRIKGRLTKIAPLLVQAHTTSPLLCSIGSLGLFFARGRVLEYTRFAILSDLVRTRSNRGVGAAA